MEVCKRFYNAIHTNLITSDYLRFQNRYTIPHEEFGELAKPLIRISTKEAIKWIDTMASYRTFLFLPLMDQYDNDTEFMRELVDAYIGVLPSILIGLLILL